MLSVLFVLRFRNALHMRSMFLEKEDTNLVAQQGKGYVVVFFLSFCVLDIIIEPWRELSNNVAF